MMATATNSEYLSIDGIPLSTAAWVTEDISELLSGPETRGADLVNAARTGELARRRTLASRTVGIPMVVNGYVDSDGVAHANAREGLVANLDELKRYLTPVGNTVAGTRTLQWVNTSSGVTREAQVHVSPAIAVAAVGPHAARIIIQMTIPGGVLRDDADTVFSIPVPAATTTVTQTINIPGTVEVQDALVVFDGDAGDPDTTGLRITNLTYEAGGGTYIEFIGDVDAALDIDCGQYSATLGATEVGGAIVTAGTAIWLPLLPGENEIEVEAPGNAVNSTLTITVRGAWA